MNERSSKNKASGCPQKDDGLDGFRPPHRQKKRSWYYNVPGNSEARGISVLLFWKRPITGYEMWRDYEIPLATAHRILENYFEKGWGRFTTVKCGGRIKKPFLLNEEGRRQLTNRLDDYQFSLYIKGKRRKP